MMRSEGVTFRMRFLWNIIPLFYVLLAVLQFILQNGPFEMMPIIVSVSSFVLISIWFAIRNSKESHKNFKTQNGQWYIFFVFALIVIATELSLKYFFGFLGEYTINIPIIFLCWNFLTMVEFSKESIGIVQAPDISEELASKWQLTNREFEITRAILKGDSNKEIASDLNISFSTVKNHIYNIYRKTGARSRIDLANLFR